MEVGLLKSEIFPSLQNEKGIKMWKGIHIGNYIARYADLQFFFGRRVFKIDIAVLVWIYLRSYQQVLL